MFTIRSASLTDKGFKRTHNEDFVAFFEPSDPLELSRSGCLYIIADGVGGAVKGERASRYAAEKVLYEYFKHPELPPADRLRELMQVAGNEIFAYASENEGQRRMATTLVAAVVRGERLTVANVGDSRAYLIRAGEAVQITRDHSEQEEAYSAAFPGQSARSSSRARHRITRSLGGELDPQVDIFDGIYLMPGDRILLCSDGLTRYASNENISRLAGEGNLNSAASKLVEFANESGGADNVSVILCAVDE